MQGIVFLLSALAVPNASVQILQTVGSSTQALSGYQPLNRFDAYTVHAIPNSEFVCRVISPTALIPLVLRMILCLECIRQEIDAGVLVEEHLEKQEAGLCRAGSCIVELVLVGGGERKGESI